MNQTQRRTIFKKLIQSNLPVSFEKYSIILNPIIKRPLPELYTHYVVNFESIKATPYKQLNWSLFGFLTQSTTLDYYLKLGYTNDEANEKLRDRQHTLRIDKLKCEDPEMYLKNFHDKRLQSIRKKTKDPEHAWKWKDTFWRRHLKNINPETGLNFTEDEAKKHQSKIQSIISKNIDRSKINFSTRVDYWLNKGLSYEDALIAFEVDCKRRTFTLEKCIAKYGEELGLVKFKDRQERWMNTMNSKSPEEKLRILIAKTKRHSFYSKQSLIVFDKLEKLIGIIGLKAENEFFLHKDGKIRFYDFCIPTLKIIVEYNGSHVHANPNLSKEKQQKWKCPFTGKTFKEKAKQDREKTQLAESHGFKVFHIWDTDSMETIVKIAKEIKKANDNRN